MRRVPSDAELVKFWDRGALPTSKHPRKAPFITWTEIEELQRRYLMSGNERLGLNGRSILSDRFLMALLDAWPRLYLELKDAFNGD